MDCFVALRAPGNYGAASTRNNCTFLEEGGSPAEHRAVFPDHIKQGPAIERRTGVRDPEPDQVSDLELTGLRYPHDGVLVVESNDGTIGQDSGFAITGRPA